MGYLVTTGERFTERGRKGDGVRIKKTKALRLSFDRKEELVLPLGWPGGSFAIHPGDNK